MTMQDLPAIWFGADAKAARKRLGLTQAELGATIDYTKTGIGLLERSNRPVSRVYQFALLYLLSSKS